MTPASDIEPLGPDERELARILRALPAGEPPAALDAKILRAAADASAGSGRQRRLGWLGAGGALWGIGSAAAAVLALGIGWQALYGRHQPAETMSNPVTVEDGAESDSVSVEFRDHTSLADQARNAPAAPPAASTAASTAAPVPALEQQPRPASPAVAQPPAMAANVATPAPEPFPDAALDEHVAARAGAMQAEASAAGAAAPAALAIDQVAAAKASSAADVSRGQAKPVPRLRPATWLAQVRALRDQGKTAQARVHLLEFRRQYPHWIIPTDLAPLLRE